VTVHQGAVPSLPATRVMPSAPNRQRASSGKLARNLPQMLASKACCAAG